MHVLPPTPLDWVLVAVATAAIMSVSIQDFFIDSRVPNPRPFYLACTLAWLAAPVATHGPFISVLAVIPIAIYVFSARREERRLEDRFGDAWRTYKTGTGMPVSPLYRLVSGRTLNWA